MFPNTGAGPGRRSGTAGAFGGGGARRVSGSEGALRLSAGAAIFFFGSAFFRSMDVRYPSRGEEGSQAEPDGISATDPPQSGRGLTLIRTVRRAPALS